MRGGNPMAHRHEQMVEKLGEAVTIRQRTQSVIEAPDEFLDDFSGDTYTYPDDYDGDTSDFTWNQGLERLQSSVASKRVRPSGFEWGQGDYYLRWIASLNSGLYIFICSDGTTSTWYPPFPKNGYVIRLRTDFDESHLYKMDGDPFTPEELDSSGYSWSPTNEIKIVFGATNIEVWDDYASVKVLEGAHGGTFSDGYCEIGNYNSEQNQFDNFRITATLVTGSYGEDVDEVDEYKRPIYIWADQATEYAIIGSRATRDFAELMWIYAGELETRDRLGYFKADSVIAEDKRVILQSGERYEADIVDQPILFGVQLLKIALLRRLTEQ
jgi:hypothetical protein